MKNLQFELSDEGWYVADPENNRERWCIAHPTEGYFPTESGAWDIFIESMSNSKNVNPIKYLGSKCTKQGAKNFIKSLIQQKMNYKTLQEAEYNYSYNEN